MLACRTHWALVPPPVRRLIWLYYREGQEIRKDPSIAYIAAQRLAVGIIYLAEGKTDRALELLEESKKRAHQAGPSVETECEAGWELLQPNTDQLPLFTPRSPS